MSIALGHFAVGATMTTLLVTYLVPTVRYPRTITLVGGVWAMVPDVHWVSPVARGPLYDLHFSPWADLFWFHRTLDGLDPGDSKTVAAVLLAGYGLATVLAERRGYRALASIESRFGTPGDTERAD